MRKNIILLNLLVLISISGYSQKPFSPETNLGVKFGGTASRVGFDPKIYQGVQAGFTGGLVFKHIAQRSLGIQLELNYLQIGWSEIIESGSHYSRQLDYIQIPFMTHVCAGTGNVRFVFNLGPYFSYLISDQEKNETFPQEEQTYYKQAIDNRADFGFCLGLGTTIGTEIGLFQIEGRANFSLTNIFLDTPETPFVASHNQFVEISLAYLMDYQSIRKALSRK